VVPAQQKVVSVYVSVAIAIYSPMPVAWNVDAVAPSIPVSHSGAPWPAAVPPTITRIVTVDKLPVFFVLATSPSLCGRYRGQSRQQKQTNQNQNYLAIAFNQSHNTSISPN
jgi:hypothetical protein